MPPAETSRQLKGLPICAAGTNNGGSGGVPSEPENLPCPRCESTNTKFCYYNNYNLSQPRYFCKSCRRYWTRGGSLRNIPVGGGTRKKHSSSSSSCSSSKRARSNNSVISEQPTPEQQYREREEEEKDKKAAILTTTTTTIPCGELVPQQHSTVTTTSSRMYGNMTAVPFPVVVKSERISSPLMMNLNETASTTTSAAVTMPPVSFTSLLGGGGMFHPQHQEGFGGFLGLSGWGLGLNGSSSSGLGFDGLGFGIGGAVGKEEWGDVLGVGGGGGGEIECKGEEEINNGVVCDGGGGGGGSSGGSSSGCNTWQLGGGSGVNDCGGLNGEDCFGWSDLAISTPGTGLE